MRKSTREVKKPEIFRFDERPQKSRDVDNDDDNASPETDEEEDLFHEKSNFIAKNHTTKSTAASKRSTTKASIASSSSSSSVPTSLFGGSVDFFHYLTIADLKKGDISYLFMILPPDKYLDRKFHPVFD